MAKRLTSLEGFWQRIQDELGQIRLEAEFRRNLFYSEAEWDVFEVGYNGLGGYRLFAWLSVPLGDGPFPGLVQMPDYGSAVDIPFTPLRHEAVVLNPSHRGQRRSDTPFEAHSPGLLTQGIGNPDTYILRGVYADALRAVDFLLEQSVVDTRSVAVSGAGLGGTLALVAGCFREKVKALAVDTPIMIGPADALELAEAYPLEELNDYLRTYPRQREAVLASLETFSPLPLARLVSCPVLLSVGATDRGQCPPPLGDELARQLGDGEFHRYPGGSEGGDHQHAVLRTHWLNEQLGLGQDSQHGGR